MSAANAIINQKARQPIVTSCSAPDMPMHGNRRHCFARWFCISVAMLFLALFLPLRPTFAEEGADAGKIVRVVTLLTEDESGDELRFPSAVNFDRDMEEIYVVNGGRSGIVIYASDFFPHLFLGAGRGIDAPQSVFFDQDGRVYVCQGRSEKRPPRLTILNAAFFVVQEIVFEEMPEAADFSPARGVIGKNNTIYLTGTNIRGVLVLDKAGKFLRWLKPLDAVRIVKKGETEASNGEVEGDDSPPTLADLTAALAGNIEEPLPGEAPPGDDADLLGMPAELRPKPKTTLPGKGKSTKLNPVLVTNITSNSDGHLFILSEETSKVYVYAPDETLLFSFGQKGGSTGKMSRPRGIAIDEEKKSIYLLDYMRHSILIFDYSGNYMYEFGGRGSGPLWFNFPTDLAIDRKGRLMVADLFNNRIQVLKPEFTTSFPKFQGVKSSSPPEENNQEDKQPTPEAAE